MSIMLAHEVAAAKELYMRVKLGMANVCWDCRKEIKMNDSGRKFVHLDGRMVCWTDKQDGIAIPMDQTDLQDWFEDIEANDETHS